MSADGSVADYPQDPLAGKSEEEVRAILRWNMARSDLYYFSRYMFLARKGYRWLRNWHHQAMCDQLMRVYLGECTRLIIDVPPRYSKTETAVVNFMAFCLGNCPDAEFIHTSYSGGLATNNAWACRELVQHEAYQALFPGVRLRADSTAKGEWRTTAGGIVYATGSGGTITGYGAGKERNEFGGAIIIDDPHKADEGSSDTVREGVIEWFQNTLESRKNSPKRTPIILIMQRLHERDLAGWLMDGGNGEQWERLVLPAIGPWDYPGAPARGGALWEDKHSLEDLRRMEAAAPVVFAGQYMQSPSAAEGNIFKPDQLRIVPSVRADNAIQWCRGWDLAATEESGQGDPDWSVGKLIGLHLDGRAVIADVKRVRGRPEEVEQLIVETAEADAEAYGRGRVKISLPQDPGQAGKWQARYLVTKLRGHTVHTSPESGDKVTRAGPYASQVNIGNVDMVQAPWNALVKSEMRVFPNGTHDDIVDAGSRAFSVVGGKAPSLNIDPNAVRTLAMRRAGMRA